MSAPLGATSPLRHGGSLARTVRRSWALLLLLVPLLLVPVVLLAMSRDDSGLTELRLAGIRDPSCVRLVVLPDVSGSMVDYAGVRADALAEVARWAPLNLRADDELGVIRWDTGAEVTLAPVRIDALTGIPASAGESLGGGGSDIEPALAAVAALPATPCRTSLVVISDSLIEPLDATATERSLRGSGVDGVALILLDGADASAEWMASLPYSSVLHADPRDRERTARALGDAIAAATGQRLVTR